MALNTAHRTGIRMFTHSFFALILITNLGVAEISGFETRGSCDSEGRRIIVEQAALVHGAFCVEVPKGRK